MTWNRTFYFLITIFLLIASTRTSSADQLCQQLRLVKGKIKTKTSTIADNTKCPKGFTLIVSTAQANSLRGANVAGAQGPVGPAGAPGQTGPQGPAGAQGVAGKDGNPGIFGDGSAGDLIISSNTSWFSNSPNANNNTQFSNLIINASRSLIVPSGTVIRCSNTCTINGSISVQTDSNGGRLVGNAGSSTENVPGVRPPIQGLAQHSAGFGELGDSTKIRSGGSSGQGLLSVFAASQVLRIGPRAAPSGAGSINISGGQGGGSLTIIARNGLTLGNTGSITANATSGGSGAGGGAGGFVILASKTAVTNNGTISVVGGNGGNATASQGNGGGGSGGIVHFVSPSITTGTVTLDGGQGAANEITINAATRIGGGGGAALFGVGGDGAAVTAGAATAVAGSPGDPGTLIQTLLDPTTLIW